MTRLRSFRQPPVEPLVYRTGTHAYTEDEMSMVTPVIVRGATTGIPDAVSDRADRLIKAFAAKGSLSDEEKELATPAVLAELERRATEARSTKGTIKTAATGLLVGGVALLAGSFMSQDKEESVAPWLIALAAGAGTAGYLHFRNQYPKRTLAAVQD